MKPVNDAAVNAAGSASSLTLPVIGNDRNHCCRMAGAVLPLFLVDIKGGVLVWRDYSGESCLVGSGGALLHQANREGGLLLSDALRLNLFLFSLFFCRSCALILHTSCLSCFPTLVNSCTYTDHFRSENSAFGVVES